MRILTEQEETLVFNDICARIPYGIKIAEIEDNKYSGAYEVITANRETKVIGFNNPECLIHCYRNMEMVRPYLRPLSSMTTVEAIEWNKLLKTFPISAELFSENRYWLIHHSNFILSNHFDYIGLIEKGLAIAVTENNNPYNL